MPGRADEGLFLRCLKPLDERVSVKLLLRIWGPRFEFFVRLILVATFLDDSIRVARNFSEHVDQVVAAVQPLAAASPDLFGYLATVVLGVGLLAQPLGSLCLVALIQPDGATKALIGWAIVQPVLYAQLANVEFVAESLSLVGGLLIMRAHLSEQAKRDGRRVPLGGGTLCVPADADSAPEVAIARTQLLGRLLLPSVYLYRALTLLGSLADAQYRTDLSFSMSVVDTAVAIGLVLGCALVAAGLKSRTIALSLSLLTFFFVIYQHPFFRYAWRENGEWKYDEVAARASIPHVTLPKGQDPEDFETWHIVDLHRYYFFQGLSTTGALLLLAQFGPGEIAIEKDEVILGDVQRARD